MTNKSSLPPSISTHSTDSIESPPPSYHEATTTTTSQLPTETDNLSPTSKTFFGALSTKLRSRSRSPAPRGRVKHLSPNPTHSVNSRKSRSRSPNTAAGKANATTTRTSAEMPQSQSSSYPIRQDSGSSTSSAATQNSQGGSSRSEWDRMTYGRHSGDWLFNGFSIKGSVKTVFNKRDSSSES